MALFNPFSFITETSMFPHARTLRTSFWHKIKDTWKVIAGERQWGINISRPGLLDFSGLLVEAGLARGLWRLGALTRGTKGLLPKFLFGVLTGFMAAITLPLTGVRMAVALAMTLTALPIVGLVHLVARGVDASRADSLQQAEAVEGSPANPDNPYLRGVSTVSQTLREYLSITGDIEHAVAEIRVSEERVSEYTLVIKGDADKKRDKEKTSKFYIRCKAQSLTSDARLRALFTHNIGGLTSIVERNSREFQPLAEALTAAPTGTAP